MAFEGSGTRKRLKTYGKLKSKSLAPVKIIQRASLPPTSPLRSIFDGPRSDDDSDSCTKRARKRTKTKTEMIQNAPVVQAKDIIAENSKKTLPSHLARDRKAQGWTVVNGRKRKSPTPKVTSEGATSITSTGTAVNTSTSRTSSMRESAEKDKDKDLDMLPRRPAPYKVQKRLQTPSTVIKKLVKSPSSTSRLNHMSTEKPGSPISEAVSPQRKRTWDSLLDTTSADDDKPSEVPQPRKGSRSATVDITRALSNPAGVSKLSPKPQTLPRRRIIDALLVQTLEEESEDETTSDESDSDESMDVATSAMEVDVMVSRSHSQLPESQNPPELLPATQSSQNGALKRTYQQQRSWLPEEDLMKELALGLPVQPAQSQSERRNRRISTPTLNPLPSFNEEEDEDGGAGAAILSIHELRQAGAKSRFSDEVRDVLDRIGSPASTSSSMRRSGLLDLAEKMKDKDFVRQFRFDGFEQKLFVHLGQEGDVIAGFLIVSLLIAVLPEGSMPQIVTHLRRQGIARLLIRLLGVRASIVVVGKERKSNMSKMAHSMLSEHHKYLLQLPIWKELQPQIVTPRTLALKCLEKMVQQTRNAGISSEIMSKELTTNIFGIMKSAAGEDSWTFPKEQAAIDFYLALSVLWCHSLAARTAQDESTWISEYLPIIAETLEKLLNRPAEQLGQLQLLTLKLTVNVTNNNAKACDVFARESLMSSMGHFIISGFERISQTLAGEDLFHALNSLLLVLATMINFAEGSLAARVTVQKLEGKANDFLESIIQIFVDNQERTSQAASIEEGSKNIAFGYLSVLLGYLSLVPSIAGRVRQRHLCKSLRPLITFIEEFTMHHKTVDEQLAADADGPSERSATMTQQAETLIKQLEASRL